MLQNTVHHLSARRLGAGAIALTALIGGGTGVLLDTALPDSAHAEVFSGIDPGGRMVGGDVLRSPDGQYTFEMQTDGNAVIYAPGHVAIWSTGTQDNRGAVWSIRTTETW